MNKQNFIDYYVNLLVRQYHDKPSAKDTIAWSVSKKAEVYSLAKQLQYAFDIDYAVGKQLDIVGKYVNMTRTFDNGNIFLDDVNYRFFIKWKIISNLNLENMQSFNEAVNNVFNGGVTPINNPDMTISYWIKYPLSDEIIDILKANKNILPAPAGVDVNYIIDNQTNKTFGFSDFKKNTVVIIDYKDISGFSEVNNDGTLDLIDGDFLSIDNIIY